MAFYLLFPLDLGFPALWIAGHPVNSAIVATFVALGVLALESRGAVLAFLREPYSIAQLLYCAFLIVSAFASASPPSAVHVALIFFCTFVLNYVVFRYVTRAYGVHWLSMVVVCVGLLAVAVGIVRGRFPWLLPMYNAWFVQQFRYEAPDYSVITARAAGTMNNPILYGLLMVLVIPYIFDIKHTALRVVAMAGVITAAGMSGSRTILVGLVFLLGAAAVYRWRMIRVATVTAVVLLLLLVPFASFLINDDARVDFLLQRAGLRPEANEMVSAAAYNFNLRRDVLAAGFREIDEEWGPLTWIIGRGYNHSATVGQRVVPWYTTVDNVYLTQLLERGLVGLALFLGAFLTFLVRTPHAARTTLHWYSPLALALAGFSFSWGTYSTFNILVSGSMAMAMWHEERERRRR